MSTLIKPEISRNNKYWISKHRYYELKHFCMQYGEWQELYRKLSYRPGRGRIDVYGRTRREWEDPTGEVASLMAECKRKIYMVEHTAVEADMSLAEYILKAVTDGVSYVHLRTYIEMPCSKEMFYDRYRRFFWLLSRKH